MLMTPAEEGAYIRLLAISWGSDGCSLPNDDNALSSLSRLGADWFTGSGDKIRQNFVRDGGEIYNIKLRILKKNLKKIISAKQKAGKEGAKKRWENKEIHSTPNATALADSNGTPIAVKVKYKVKDKLKEKENTKEEIHNVHFEEFWERYGKKTGKTDCLTWYNKNASNGTHQKIMDSITKWEESGNWDDRQYQFKPINFLRKEYWKEDPPIRNKGKNPDGTDPEFIAKFLKGEV